MGAETEFGLLGSLLVRQGARVVAVPPGKQRVVLAALLLSAGRVLSLDELAEALWEGSAGPPASARVTMQNYVKRLRQLLGDSRHYRIATRPDGYLMTVDADELDKARFEALIQDADQSARAGSWQRASAELHAALALWRGQPLADVPSGRLVLQESPRLEELHLQALEARIDADLHLGRHGEVIAEAAQLAAEQPLREKLHGLLMLALYRDGRQADSLAAYRSARRLLTAELGVEPGPQLQRLHQQILTADPALLLPLTPDEPFPSLLDGLRVALRPLAAGLLPGPLLSGPPSLQVPSQLPADIADFTGRAGHLGQLRALLAGAPGGEYPAVMTVAVVAGTPGLGKTALAVHAAHALRRDFPGGQLYVSLHGASEQPVVPEEILARMLRDLGVSPDQIPAGQEERAALYRTRLTDRRVLIVLDDAGDAAQVRPLLPGSASCAVIVTSRHRLADLAGSRLVDLEVLGDDEARGLLTAIIGQDRAAAEPGPVREVLDACAGLPLAIRIAGARLTSRRGWAVRTLARRLADQRRRVDELTAGDLAVRACFDVSFDSLRHLATGDGVDPARAFCLLGLWQGPRISLQAAAALLGQPEDPVAGALEILVDAHLLESPAPEWYGLHDLLRAYAAERARALETPEAVTGAVGRLLRWYLGTADSAASVVAPYRDRVPDCPADGALQFATADEALEWSRQERANLVVATRQAAAYGLHDVAWKLPVAIMACFDRHGYRAEWLATHQVALASARTAGDPHGEAWILNNIGMVLSQQRADNALSYLEQALELHRKLGNRRGQAQATNNIAFHYQFQGMHERAIPALHDSLDLQRQVGHRYGEGVALCSLGEACLELGHYEEAIACSQEALPIAQEIGSTRLEGYVLHNLGRAHLDLGHATEGAKLLKQALAIHDADGGKSAQALVLQHLGAAYVRADQPDDAREAWQRAVRMFEILGDDKQAARIRSDLEELGPSQDTGVR